MRNKILLFLLIIILPLTVKAKTLEFYDGYMYAELKGRYSKNTNFPNKLNETFQQIEMKMRLNITPKLEGYAFFKTEYSQFNWKKEDRLFFLNSMGVKYKFNPVTELKFGSMVINYSQYIIFAYPWFTDIFRGLEFKIDRSDLTFETFLANNGEDPDESWWHDENPDFSANINYDYSTIKLGYDKNGIKQEHPSIWGGVYFRKSFNRNNFVTPEIKFYYLYENYLEENKNELWSQVYKNHIIGAEGNFNILNWLNCDLFYGTTIRNYDEYSIKTNYFGAGKDYYELTQKKSIKYPKAMAINLKVNDFLGKIFGTHNLQMEYKYETIDREYNPVYMEGNLFDKRSLTLSETSVYSGRKQSSFWFMQDLILGLSAGYGYSMYQYDYTIKENSIRTALILSKMFRLHFNYYFNRAENGLFPDGIDKVNSYYLTYEGDILDNVFVSIEFGKNLNYRVKYDQLLVKLMMWGW